MSQHDSKHKNSNVLTYAFHRHYKESVPIQDRMFLRERFNETDTLYRRELSGHYGCVNAIEFSNNGGQWIVSGGDDRRVLLWNAEEGLSGITNPRMLSGEHNSNIFCLAFDHCNKKVFSGGNDKQVIVHDIASGAPLDVFNHEDAVYGLSADPINDSIFASACDDGRVLIFDIRAPPSEEPFVLANYTSAMHAVMYNPMEPRLLATANTKEGVGLWDIRKPKTTLMKYGGNFHQQSCMSVRINALGDRLVALRRRLPPVLYSLSSPTPLLQFDHSGYYNSCTMKSCCFAGDRDQYIISGSDDFNLYVWKIPESPSEGHWVGEAHIVLKGHRSIVNQVRFNPSNHLVISSGVEKVIQMWSPFEIPGTFNSNTEEKILNQRPVYTHEEYINLVLRSGQVMSHDYSHQSTEEDPRMMAFFDSLVQRELEGWISDDSLESTSDFFEHMVQPSHSENSDNSQSGEDNGLMLFTLAFERAVANRTRETGEVQNNNNNQPDSVPGEDNSSVVQAVNATEESANGSNVTLPGQRPNQTRKSITDLITQKRKEYLASVRRAEKGVKKKKRKTKDPKAAENGEQDSSTDTSSSDSSSGDNKDTDTHRKNRKRKSANISSSSDSSSETENKDISKLLSTKIKPNAVVQKLKRLRARMLKSDSDSDSGEKVVTPFTGACKDSGRIGENIEPTPSTSGTSEACSEIRDANTCVIETAEMGPYLSEAILDNVKSESKHSNAAANGVSKPLLVDSPQVSSPCTNCTEAKDAGSTVTSNHLNINGGGAHTLAPSASTSNGAVVQDQNANNHNTNAGGQQPTWEAFKSFKNKVERARRHYRRRSSSQAEGHTSSGNESS